ncbi:uncharacterized protein LOC131652094 [Vicia villosa]|uniref:uncharacterized protein LOC131652094 n=1 Tax=Vicia villosa TaxID=3911 RepID=UPI00273ADCF4|nr:uncharacterized protein LOC131652094 [Vicia villosa]
MASTKLLLLVLCLGVCVGICRSWVEDVAEEDTQSLPDWARNTFSQSLGSENDDATQNMKYKAEEATGSDEILRMPTDHKVTDKASNIAHNVYDIKNDVNGKMDCGGNDNNAFGVYDEAKAELSDAYMSARNSMTEEAKAKYEAAKEKASEATGNLGAKMRNTP